MKKFVFGLLVCALATSLAFAEDAQESIYIDYDPYAPAVDITDNFKNFEEDLIGGAILNYGNIGKVTGDFTNNSVINVDFATSYYSYSGGGGLYVTDT